MNQTALAIIIAGILIAGSIWLSAPRYAITTENDGVMRIDTMTGKISFCRATSFVDEPLCSPWGEKSLEQFRADRKAAAVAAPKPRETTTEEVDKMLKDFLDREDTSQP
ncbi:hypothetical protein [Rhizobium sp. Leaf262]|uniref:hypothetical protein n=1 Tax=Rhizobium sp. Leaf262 TaxID=1736312 RepID=UPI000714F461|nr:hypothetical protein [Rhizobium sp. Leaf262]KQO79450.1 hypothetical protein ASF29_23355 [Rhizobium sp. Leaf262]